MLNKARLTQYNYQFEYYDPQTRYLKYYQYPYKYLKY